MNLMRRMNLSRGHRPVTGRTIRRVGVRALWVAGLAGGAVTTLAGCTNRRPSTEILEAEAFRRPLIHESAAEGPATSSGPSMMSPASVQDAESAADARTLGGVVARVNGRPIYSHELLHAIAPDVAERTADLPPEASRPIVAQAMRERLGELIREELELAAAQRTLSPRERAEADARTTAWRQEQITRAGGSLALARQAAREQGHDFDDLVRRRHGEMMRQVYHQRRVLPRVQVTAADLRRHYEANLAERFTLPGGIELRMIRLEGSDAGPRADDLIRRVRAGEDFATLAASELNADPVLRRNAGDLGLGLVERGGLRLSEVEAAAWDVPEGGVTTPVETDGAVYVARVERRDEGGVIRFEDAQEQIRRDLQMEQFQALQGEIRQQLLEDAAIEQNAPMLNTTLELAVRRFSTATRPGPDANRGVSDAHRAG